jgi:hypothetical protein
MNSTLPKKQLGFSLQRQSIVGAAFNKFDPNGSGLVPLKVLTDAYCAEKHPHVSQGDMAPAVAARAMINALTPSAKQHSGSVAVEDFVLFHERMSAEVDEMQIRNADAYFVNLVDGLWGVSTVHLAPTSVVPITMDVPRGILASKKLDLVWRDDAGSLRGFKGVVKPTFARSWLPQDIQGLFVFPEEAKSLSITYLPSQPAIQPPYSIVWSNAGESFGLQDVIASNVDVALLPSSLRSVILTTKEVAARSDIQFRTIVAPANPMYMTTNSGIGAGVHEATAKVQLDKTTALNGENPVGVFAGRVGKFTGTFAGGMPVASGLNFSVKA